MLVVLPLFPRYWLGPNLSQTQRGRDYEDILSRLAFPLPITLQKRSCFSGYVAHISLMGVER
jgi:hypothetical protein